MVTFVAKNSGGVKKKPIILKLFFFSFSFIKQGQRLAGMRGFTLKWEQPWFFIKLQFTVLELENNPKIH